MSQRSGAMAMIKCRNFSMTRSNDKVIRLSIYNNNSDDYFQFNVNSPLNPRNSNGEVISIEKMLNMHEGNKKNIKFVLLKSLLEETGASSYMQNTIDGGGLTFTIEYTDNERKLIVKIDTNEKTGIYEMPIAKTQLYQMLSLIEPCSMLLFESE